MPPKTQQTSAPKAKAAPKPKPKAKETAKEAKKAKASVARSVAARAIGKRRTRDHASTCRPLAVYRARDALFAASEGRMEVSGGRTAPVRLSPRLVHAMRTLTDRFVRGLNGRVAHALRRQRVQTVRLAHLDAAVLAALGASSPAGGAMLDKARTTCTQYQRLREAARAERAAHK